MKNHLLASVFMGLLVFFGWLVTSEKTAPYVEFFFIAVCALAVILLAYFLCYAAAVAVLRGGDCGGRR